MLLGTEIFSLDFSKNETCYICSKNEIKVDGIPNQKLIFENNNLNIEDSTLSNLHAKIYVQNNEFFIEDMGSTNGTWNRVIAENSLESEPHILKDQDILRIGEIEYKVCRN